MRPYFSIFKTALRQEGANPRRLLIGCLVTLFRVSLLAVIYKVAYTYAGSTSLSYANAIWSFGVYFAFILNLGLRDIFKAIEQDVINGEVETQLVKPVDWRLAKIAELIGKKLPEFVLQLMLLPVLLFTLVGPPQVDFWTPVFLATFLLLAILAMVCAVCLFMLVGFMAFWLNDAKSVYRIVDKAVLIFGGGFVPIALLPIALQVFVRYTPIGIYAAPTQVFNPAITEALVPTVLSATIWAVVLVWGVNHVWHRAQTRLEVNGG